MPKQSPRGGIAVVLVFVATLGLPVTAGQASAENDGSVLPSSPLPQTSVEQSDCGAVRGSTAGVSDASAAEAQNLFAEHFPCILHALAADPPDSEPNPDAIAAEQASSEPSTDFAVWPLPLRTVDESGHQSPVDLTLEVEGDGFKPASPLVDLTLPADLGHEVAIGDRGMAIDIGAIDPEAAEEAGAEPLAGEGRFYADAAPSTDVVLAPISSGLESVYQLRSPESPEHFEMEITLPDGASLEPGIDGGAQVVEEGETVASVYPPTAIDTSGDPVPATMTVNGDSLEIDVPHSDANIVYPIAVTATTGSFVSAIAAATTRVTPAMDQVADSPSELGHADSLGAQVVRGSVVWCNMDTDDDRGYKAPVLQKIVDYVYDAHTQSNLRTLVTLRTSAPAYARSVAQDSASCGSLTENGLLPTGEYSPNMAGAHDYGLAMKKVAWCLNGDPRCNDNLVGGGTVTMHGPMLDNGWVYGFEAGNETNTRLFWQNGTDHIFRADAQIYQAALESAVDAVHAYRSEIPVGSAGTSYGRANDNPWGSQAVDGTAYLDQVLSYGNPGADAYSIHPYGPDLHPNMVYSNGVRYNADVVFDSALTRQALLNRGYGYTDPIWITEVGMDADDNDDNDVTSSEEGQQFLDLYYTWWNSIRAICSSYNVPLASFWTFKDEKAYGITAKYFAGFAKITGGAVDYSKLAYYHFNGGQYFATNTCTG